MSEIGQAISALSIRPQSHSNSSRRTRLDACNFMQPSGIYFQVSLTMAHPLPRLASRRLCQVSTPFPRTSNSLPRTFRAAECNFPARRTYATGESGPNPTPGKSPFKIWPFVAITLGGSGLYALMVKSRAGMKQLGSPYFLLLLWSFVQGPKLLDDV